MRKRKGYFKNARVPQRSGVAGLVNVPRLEELLADPEQIGVLDPQTTRVLKHRQSQYSCYSTASIWIPRASGRRRKPNAATDC